MKIYKLISAVVVSIAAFFELCLTGRACRAWRMARSDNSVLSSKGPGAGTADFTSIPPRPGIFVSRVTGRVSHSSPHGPALKISRKVNIGMYSAMTIFLVFCLAVFVICPDGRSFAEDGTQRIDKNQIASGTATEGQSSITRGEKIVGVGLMALSILIVAGTYLNGLRKSRKESLHGKEGKGNRRQD